jgi:hypothetical protein
MRLSKAMAVKPCRVVGIGVKALRRSAAASWASTWRARRGQPIDQGLLQVRQAE